VNLKKVRTKAVGIGAKNINTRKSYFFLCGKKGKNESNGDRCEKYQYWKTLFFPLWQKRQSEDCIQVSTSQ
jgi:hypothetical protein